RGNPDAARTIGQAADRALSIVSLMELLQGARSKLEVRQIQQSLFQLDFSILPLSESIGATASSLIEQYTLTAGIQVADALIAATASLSGQRLCTANTKHFSPIRSLSLLPFRP
ncbi:MAG TPA: PIN domain-containing protein, partial [Bryobacteraceae bacterium]